MKANKVGWRWKKRCIELKYTLRTNKTELEDRLTVGSEGKEGFMDDF
jgi:hypothetical protein